VAEPALDRIYPVLLIDAIVVKIRDGQVANRPIYVAMGINLDGERDVLGLWVGPAGGEGAKFWMTLLTELRNRGVQDTFIACCDGLKGLPDPIRATWPQAEVQLCVVHLVRSSLRYTSKKHWGRICRELREIYTAPTIDAAEVRFAEFADAWRDRYPAMINPGNSPGASSCRSSNSRRATHRRLHHERDREPECPVPAGGAAPGPLPQRASSVESALPRRHREGPILGLR
jgi:transposase-like protein